MKQLLFALVLFSAPILHGQDTLSFREFRVGMSGAQLTKAASEKCDVYNSSGATADATDGDATITPSQYKFDSSTKLQRYLMIAQLRDNRKVAWHSIQASIKQQTVAEIIVRSEPKYKDSVDLESLAIWVKACVEACSSKYGKPTEIKKDFKPSLSEEDQVAAHWKMKDGNYVKVGVFFTKPKDPGSSPQYWSRYSKFYAGMILGNEKLQGNTGEAPAGTIISSSGL